MNKGGEVLAQMLQEEGVTKVFGIIDGTYFGFYAMLKKYGIDLITPRHETSALHMAGAYARLTGKLGVCMASNGPGVANALPGVAVENAEGNRILLITSKRRLQITHPDRGGAYQNFDQTAVIRPMSKWSESVTAPGRIAELMRMALRESYKGRPGVVHLDIPENIMNGDMEQAPVWKKNQYRRVGAVYPDPAQVALAADMLIKAETPMIHAGSGVIHSRAFAELEELTQLLMLPVTTSWAARSVLSEANKNAMPMPYVKINNKIRNDSDVVLVLGSRLGETDWWGKAPYWKRPFDQKMIQVDIDDSILGMNKPAEMTVLSDIKIFLQALIKKIKENQSAINLKAREKRISQYDKDRKAERKKLDAKLSDTNSPMLSAHVPAICREVFADDAVCIMDGGNTAVWANFYQEFPVPNTAISTFKFGMLGAGVSQALGAAAARPDKQIYCIIGDGAMGFHPQEIETAVRNNLKPIFLVLSDRQWGMVKLTQEIALAPIRTLLFKKLPDREHINTDLNEIQWDMLAQSMGAFGARAASPEELKNALHDALKSDQCAVIHVDVDPVKHKWVPGLMDFKDMHQEPKGK